MIEIKFGSRGLSPELSGALRDSPGLSGARRGFPEHSETVLSSPALSGTLRSHPESFPAETYSKGKSRLQTLAILGALRL
eukprot:8062291-Alexandrium_andersonii.AAC.1